MGTEHLPVEAVVALYDSGERPVTAGRMVEELCVSNKEADETLERLRHCGFITEEGAGYRPTVTAREFLALDDVAGPVIVDQVEADAENTERG
jgi:hypothetical protein